MATSNRRGSAFRLILRAIAVSAAAAVTVSLFCLPAAANDSQGAKMRQPYQLSPPPKDCTRLNGRFGYYGNPWCNEAEQLRWDRWSARNSFLSGRQ